MRGFLKKRYKGSWSLVFDDYQTDTATGGRTRKRKWVTFRSTAKHAQKCSASVCSERCPAHAEAEAKLAELLRDVNRGEWVEPTKLTLGEWLKEWVEKTAKPPLKAAATYAVYTRIIEQHIVPKLGAGRLQALKPLDLERYYADLVLSPASVGVHHAIIHSSLDAAVRSGLLTRNVAALVSNKPKVAPGHADVMAHVWDVDEARQFLDAAKAAGPQPAAFYDLALSTGMRRGELCGVKWTDLDAKAGRLTVQRQLLKSGAEPVFGPVKNKVPRVLDLAPETLRFLLAHKQHQAEVKLKNRLHYRDHGLMFAKEWTDVRRPNDALGDPLQSSTLGQREYARLIATAQVRRIKFHGLRHTCATLLLQQGVQPHVVQRRLGHKKISITLDIYAHALPGMQQDAAQRLAAVLHG